MLSRTGFRLSRAGKAGVFWKLIGSKVPANVPHVRAHMSKPHTVALGVSEEWRGYEIVDNLARNLAERAFEGKELRTFKDAFDRDVTTMKKSLASLKMHEIYQETNRTLWKDHEAQMKGGKGGRQRRRKVHREPVWHPVRGIRVWKACGSTEQACVTNRRRSF